jgi:hypothetical protein
MNINCVTFSFVIIAVVSVFGLWNVWIATSERVTYQTFCWKGLYWRGWEVTYSVAWFLFIPSFGYPHAGLCHQGQGPKTVEATIPTFTLILPLSRSTIIVRALFPKVVYCIFPSEWAINSNTCSHINRQILYVYFNVSLFSWEVYKTIIGGHLARVGQKGL